MRITESGFEAYLSDCTDKVAVWERLVQDTAVETMVEIGVWKGDYAEPILKHCPSIERYYMIDPWAPLPDWNKPFNVGSEAFNEYFEQTMKRTEFAASKRMVLRGSTKEVIDEIPDGTLDFAYLDGDHTLRGMTIDLLRVLPKVKEGGLIGGDDFIKKMWQHGARYEPTLVCPFSVYFAEAMDLPIRVLPFAQFVIQNTADAAFTFIDPTGRFEDLSLKLPRRTAVAKVKRGVKKALTKLGLT